MSKEELVELIEGDKCTIKVAEDGKIHLECDDSDEAIVLSPEEVQLAAGVSELVQGRRKPDLSESPDDDEPLPVSEGEY